MTPQRIPPSDPTTTPPAATASSDAAVRPSFRRRAPMRRRPTLFALSVAAALSTAAAACGGPQSPAEARAELAKKGKGDIVIAAVWPWEEQKEVLFGQGVDLALEEIDAGGGVLGRRLRVERYDDHESVNDGRLIAERVSSDPNVVAVIGHLQSYVTVPAAGIYDQAGLVMVAPASTSAELTSKGYGRVFRTIFTDRETGEQMADYALAHGYRRLAIYYVRSQYGRDLANAFEERAAARGATVVARASYDPAQQTSDVTVQQVAREWKEMGPDAVFLAGEVPQAGPLIASFRRAGMALPVLGGDAMSSPALITRGGGAVEGTVVAAAFSAHDPRPEVQSFVAAFRRRWGVPPDAGSALGYDAVHVLAKAMEEAGSTDPAAVAAAMHRVRYAGVTGPIAFTRSGDLLERRMVKVAVHDGQFRFVDETTPPATLASASPPPSSEP